MSSAVAASLIFPAMAAGVTSATATASSKPSMSGAARLLAAAGHEVTLAAAGYAAGESLQQYVRERLLAAVARQRITVLPLMRPYGVDEDTIYLQHVLTEEPVLVEGVAGLVLACGASPAAELLESLESAGLPTIGIGDCLAPRTVEEAVLDGLVAASAI